MGRDRTPLPEIAEAQRREVEAVLPQRELSPRVRERLEMVKAAALGYDHAQIATWTGRSPRRIAHWVHRFVTQGRAALADAPRCGHPVTANAAYRAALEAAVTMAPSELELPFDVWTSARLSAYLAETTGVRVSPGWIRVMLTDKDFACGRPKHTMNHLQDPREVTACRETLAEVGGKGAGGAGTRRTASSR